MKKYRYKLISEYDDLSEIQEQSSVTNQFYSFKIPNFEKPNINKVIFVESNQSIIIKDQINQLKMVEISRLLLSQQIVILSFVVYFKKFKELLADLIKLYEIFRWIYMSINVQSQVCKQPQIFIEVIQQLKGYGLINLRRKGQKMKDSYQKIHKWLSINKWVEIELQLILDPKKVFQFFNGSPIFAKFMNI